MSYYAVFHSASKRREVRLVNGSGMPRVFASTADARRAIGMAIRANILERLNAALPRYENGEIPFEDIFEKMWILPVEFDADGFVYTECGDKFPREKEYASRI